MSGWRRALVAGALAVGVSFATTGRGAEPPATALGAKPVPMRGSTLDPVVAGKVRLLRMFELPTVSVGELRLVGLSGLAWDADDDILYALSDQGALFHLRPIFKDGVLSDMRLLGAAALRSPKSGKRLEGGRGDSEGLAILNADNGRKGDSELLVSFERMPRILRFRPDGQPLQTYRLPPPLRDIRHYSDDNKALEAVAISPRHGIVTAPEAALRDKSQARLFSLNGGAWPYSPAGSGNIVALEAWGADGLLVMERDFRPIMGRIGIALRRIKTLPAKPVAPQTETLALLENSAGFHLDNFEGLARHRGNRYFLVSDNNDLFLQRTLLLYVELLE